MPEWGVVLREREDIVYWAGVYYYYDAGHWYVARSIRGPWARVETLGSAIGEEIPGTAGVERPTTATGDRHARKGPPSETERRGSVVEIAKKYLGAPYAWGGSSPAGFDCSGFVRYVYAQAGTSLPHNAASQYRYGTSVPRDELAPGDLVFFDGLRHNGIYVGDGRFIHAGKSAGGVTLSSLDEPWYSSRWVGGRRL